jgi:hypothetical protein
MRALRADDGHFLAGLIDAEGCFQVRTTNGGISWLCSFNLALRDDDAELVAHLQELTGLGRLARIPAKGTSRPQASWSIHGRSDSLQLSELLDRFPLRGRKRREGELWSAAVRALSSSPRPASLPLLAAQIRSP